MSILNDVFYAQSINESSYLSSSVENGVNENDTEILDFLYRFPLDKSSGIQLIDNMRLCQFKMQIGIIKSIPLKQQSECLDSGQGCGGGTPGLSISGSMAQGTENTGKAFRAMP